MAKEGLLPSKAEEQMWGDIMARLQATWNANYEKMSYVHEKAMGIRSTQIGALVMMLIKMGIIK